MGAVSDANRREKHVKVAARAMSDLHIFSAVIALMESSLVTSDAFDAEAKIVAICKRECTRALHRYDNAAAAAGR